MQHKNKRWRVVVGLFLTVLLLAACGGTEPLPKEEPSHVEEIPGSEFNLVTFTEKAAERIGIETALIREEEATRTQTVKGQVVVDKAEVVDQGPVLVRVSLLASDVKSVDRDQPALVMLMDDEDGED